MIIETKTFKSKSEIQLAIQKLAVSKATIFHQILPSQFDEIKKTLSGKRVTLIVIE